ncbi:cyclic nucleotide-binding domain-containing protein [Bdellovibrionota bacterium FG-1]
MSLANKLLHDTKSDAARLQRAEDRIAYLNDVSLFEDIRAIPGALEDLARRMEVRTFERDQFIIKEGELGSELFLLIQGQAGVYKMTGEGDMYKVVILSGEKHAFFGEGGLLDSDARSASIQAEGHCVCLVLNSQNFVSFAKTYPDWALPILLKICRVVMGRLRKTNNDMMLLYNALVTEIRGH